MGRSVARVGLLYEVDERAQRRGQVAASGIVEERPRKALPPRFENRLQRAAVEMRTKQVFEQMNDADAGDSATDCEIDRGAGAHEQRPRRIQLQYLAIALEVPGRRRAAGELTAQAGVSQQLTRMPGPAVRVEIGGGRGRREALHARPDRDRYHVLLEALVVANARVAANRQHVDEAVLDHHFDAYLRIKLKKLRDDAGQYDARRARRHVQLQRAGRLVPEAIEHVQRRFHFVEKRREFFDQTQAGFGR